MGDCLERCPGCGELYNSWVNTMGCPSCPGPEIEEQAESEAVSDARADMDADSTMAAE